MHIETQKALDRIVGVPLLVLLKPIVLAAGWLVRRDHSLPARGRLLVIKMLGGGSLVVALPALLGLRRAYPGTRLTLLTTIGVAPFGRALGLFDEIVVIDPRSIPGLAWTAARALLRCLRPDCVLDLEVYSKLTSVFSVLTCARNRLGFYLESVLWRRPIQTHLVFFNRSTPSHLFYERMVGLLGAAPASYEECRAHVLGALGLGAREGPRGVALGVGCSSLARERMLDREQWLAVFRERLERQPEASGEPFLFLGAEEDGRLANAVIDGLRSAGRGLDARNLCGTLDLAGSLRVLAGAREFWGIDSALLHWARLFGLKVVSFWGPTSPRTLLKPFPIAEEVAYSGIACSPCVHVAESPPCEGRNLCMTSLLRPLTEEERRELLPVLRQTPGSP